jgi:hypothetical protein
VFTTTCGSVLEHGGAEFSERTLALALSRTRSLSHQMAMTLFLKMAGLSTHHLSLPLSLSPSLPSLPPSSPDGIRAGGAVLADGGAELALVDVLVAEFSRVVGWALAVVFVDGVDARAAVLAEVPQAVVHVDLAAEGKHSHTKLVSLGNKTRRSVI